MGHKMFSMDHPIGESEKKHPALLPSFLLLIWTLAVVANYFLDIHGS